MIAIISLLVILTLSILVTRIATIALSHTGLSRETARFQSRSAFTGVGFTTSEAEKVVNHPVRRRILLILMLLGNVGIITAISSLILSFVSQENGSSFNFRIIFLVAGLTLLLIGSQSQFIDRHLSRLIEWALDRYTTLDIKDYAGLLDLSGEYRVSELKVEANDWLSDKKLKDLNLRDEGILVLGIRRANGEYLGAPRGETEVRPKDVLVMYGRESLLESLDKREKGFLGDQEHEEAVRDQEQIQAVEEKQDAEKEAKQQEKRSKQTKTRRHG